MQDGTAEKMRELQTKASKKTSVRAGALISLSSLILASSEAETCGVFLACHLGLTYPLRVCGYFWLFRIYCTDPRSEKITAGKNLTSFSLSACL